MRNHITWHCGVYALIVIMAGCASAPKEQPTESEAEPSVVSPVQAKPVQPAVIAPKAGPRQATETSKVMPAPAQDAPSSTEPEATVSLPPVKPSVVKVPVAPAPAAEISAPSPDSSQAPRPKVGSPEADVKQKLDYAKQIINGKSSQRIMLGGAPEAKDLLTRATQKYAEAEAAFDAKDLAQTSKLADEAIRLYHIASRKVPSESVMAQQKAQFADLLKQLEGDKIAHKNSVERAKASGGKVVNVDNIELQRLVGEAHAAVSKGDYIEGNIKVIAAQKLVQNAIKGMVHGQTVVYSIDISTPEKEYAYEYDRYLGYEELIPVAIEQRLPTEQQKKMMMTLADKGKWMASEARKKAAEKDYPVAIRMIMDATEEVRKALKVVGITQ